MTPELKSACELVFREHKISSGSVNWSKDAFHGRLSFGLSAMAKETLLNKNIIYLPNPTKKLITVLNPAVSRAATFEEAEELIQKRVPSIATSVANDQPAYSSSKISHNSKHHNFLLLKITGNPETSITETKWYARPLFSYFVWPVCAAAAGAFITYLIGFVYTKLFF